MSDQSNLSSFLKLIKEVIMKNRGILLALTAAAALFLAFYPSINNSQKEATLIKSIIAELNFYHYHPLEINDSFSVKAFNLFLTRLDGGRRWFTEDDINQLEVWKYKLDDEANDGTFAFLDLAVQLQNTSLKKTQNWYREILSQPFDFTQKGSIQIDGKKKEIARDDDALKKYWSESLKWETLSRLMEKLEKKEKGDEDFKDKSEEELEAEARKDVLKVYDDWYVRLDKRKRTDYLSSYLNTFTNIYDPHTEYYEPIDKQNFDIGMSGRLEGIGARLQTDGDFTKVNEIIVGGPAWKQGALKANDQILKVAQGNEAEWTEINGMVINDVVQLIRGKPGTKVRLFVKRAEGGTAEIEIIRDVVIIEEGFAKSLIIEAPRQERIGYIYLPKFYADFNDKNGRRCSDDIAIELEKLKQSDIKGIILDLRSNGGGSLRDVVKMGGFFIEEGPIVQVKSRERRPEVLTDDDPSVQYGGPLIVMVNQYSASASEILAAALQDYGRAVIVGSPTFGKGTVQRFFDLDALVRGNSDVKPLGEIKLTVQKFFRVNGGSTQLKGVTPDIIFPDPSIYLETGEKDEDFPMAWTHIDPVPYSQQVYNLSNLSIIKGRATDRINNNEIFQKIDERARRIKQIRDNSTHPLNLKEYQAENEQLKAQDKEYNKLFENEVLTDVRNLPVDLPGIEADEGRKARNDDWLKNIKKDVYLFETINIMHDMLRIN